MHNFLTGFPFNLHLPYENKLANLTNYVSRNITLSDCYEKPLTQYLKRAIAELSDAMLFGIINHDDAENLDEAVQNLIRRLNCDVSMYDLMSKPYDEWPNDPMAELAAVNTAHLFMPCVCIPDEPASVKLEIISLFDEDNGKFMTLFGDLTPAYMYLPDSWMTDEEIEACNLAKSLGVFWCYPTKGRPFFESVIGEVEGFTAAGGVGILTLKNGLKCQGGVCVPSGDPNTYCNDMTGSC